MNKIERWAICEIAKGNMWKLFEIYKLANSDRSEAEKLQEISAVMRTVGIHPPNSPFVGPEVREVLQVFTIPVLA